GRDVALAAPLVVVVSPLCLGLARAAKQLHDMEGLDVCGAVRQQAGESIRSVVHSVGACLSGRAARRASRSCRRRLRSGMSVSREVCLVISMPSMSSVLIGMPSKVTICR